MMVSRSSVSIQKSSKTYCIFAYLLTFLIIFSFFFFTSPDVLLCDTETAVYDDRIDISADAAIVVNYETGDILWEKNSSILMYPASITKILSSIVAIENIDDMEAVTKISKNASGKNHSVFRFKSGDSMTLLDLLKATLICSHNNAIIALAEYVSGNKEEIEIINTNTLLDHDYIKGIKTGSTINAGFCLVIYSEKENLKLITVTMNSASPEERDRDALKLLDWAYNNLDSVKIADLKQPVLTVSTGGPTIAGVDLYPDRDYIRLININSDVVDIENRVKNDIALPVKENDVMGTMEVIVNDKKIEEIDLIAREDISNASIYEELSTKKEVKTIYILIFLLVFYFLTFTIIIVRNLLLKRHV